jgi:hypothetical protein
MATKRTSAVLATLLLVIGAVCYAHLTIFVVPPIGAVPEGRTLVISRLNVTRFIDSADGMCERMQGGVSLLCRGMLMGTVAEKATIYFRLPYSDTLYLWSTGGRRYDWNSPADEE